jgi:hypothetical protein
MKIHPKTSGAALGVSLGVILDAILHSLHGVHLDPSVYGAIPGFLGIVTSWLSPPPPTEVTPVASNQPPKAVQLPPPTNLSA